MRRLLSSVSIFAGCLLLLLAIPPLASAAPPSGEERLLDALEGRMDLEVVKTPLASVVKLLREKSGVALRIDAKQLDNSGVDVSAPVTFRGKNFRLRSILAHVLAPHSLTWAIRDEALVVTTQEEANNAMTVRVYPVGDLQVPGQAVGWLQSPSSPIAALIQSTVVPQTWEQVGGPGSLREVKNHLVVRQTPEVHREIARTFDLMRSVIDSHRKWDGKQRPVPGLENSASLRLPGDDDAALARALETPVTLSVEKMTLAEAVNFLAEKTGMAFSIDEKGLADAGIEMSSELTIHAKEIPLRSAIREMLKPVDLSYRIWNETIQITTPDAVQQTQSLRMYPLYDLVRAPRPSDLDLGDNQETTATELEEIIHSTVEPATWDTSGGAGSLQYYPQPGVLVVSQAAEVHDALGDLLGRLRAKLPVLAKEDRQAEGQRYVTRIYRLLQNPPMSGLPEVPPADELAVLVAKVVAPESWADKNAAIHSAKGVLVVRQRAEIHAKIERLLGDLGAIAPALGGAGGMGGIVPVAGSAAPGGTGAPARGGFFAVPGGK